MISIGAVLLFMLVRALPTSEEHLNYTDFHADGKGVLDFCEPGSASFVPVETVRSPVSLTLTADGPFERDRTVGVRAHLTAAGGKALSADNLLVVHTRKLHLLVADASLSDYQHIHPVPTDTPGEFAFSFTPRTGGDYRAYADFTPRATGRALYAGASFEVRGPSADPQAVESLRHTVGGVEFSLGAAEMPIRINRTATLTLTMRRIDGGILDLEIIMDAYAHMVAFDFARQGFAHLHPRELDPTTGDAGTRRLSFLLNLPDPGWYRVWAQVLVGGEALFAPFTIEVVP